MKNYNSMEIPSWLDLEISGVLIEEPLTYFEFIEAYKNWVPSDNISFDKLLNIVVSGEDNIIMRGLNNDGNIHTYFRAIFDLIPNGNDRKRALALLLKEIGHYKHDHKMRRMQKKGMIFGYNKNNTDKVRGNKNAAIKVYESLYEGSSDETKTTKLANLLLEYVAQCDEILNSQQRVTEPLEIKDYRLHSQINKKTLSKANIRSCMENIIKEFNIEVDEYTIRIAIESING